MPGDGLPLRILVADDDDSIRGMLKSMLTEWGYEVVTAENGDKAWEIMQAQDAPRLAICDWNMPGLTGVEVIRNVRAKPRRHPPYILLLTAKDKQADILEGLQAGASDYVTKPFDYDELRARVNVGAQIIGLQAELGERVSELEEALRHVQRLQGMLPICSYCKKIRDDQNYWHGVEEYISSCSEALFTHGVCPDCYTRFVRPEIKHIKRA
jgi:CheY-like chemotaxis protein